MRPRHRPLEQALSEPSIPLPGADASGFRPVHYLGNKWRVLDVIKSIIDDVASPRAVACDLFAGSGVVSQRLAMSRPVIASDVQEYSRVLVSALSKPEQIDSSTAADIIQTSRQFMKESMEAIHELLDLEVVALHNADHKPEGLAEIIEHNPIAVSDSRRGHLEKAMRTAEKSLPANSRHTMLRYYGGVYFSYAQAVALDAVSEAIATLPERSQDTARASLLSTASEISSTVGNHFAQPVRPRDSRGRLKTGWVNMVRKRRQIDVLDRFTYWLGRYATLQATPFWCAARAEDYRTTLTSLGSEVGVIYADPPYTRDHYSRFYHVLETLALADEPGITTSMVGGDRRPSRGLYREKRHQSPFSIRSKVRPAFTELFVGARQLGIPLVLSYSPSTVSTVARPQPRLLTIPDLVELAKPFFRSVTVESAGRLAHSKFNNQRLNGLVDYEAEVFLVGEP